MTSPSELRAKADRCRWAASIRTDGGARADRVLLALAERLEQEAVTLEALDCYSDRPARGASPKTDR